MAAFSKAVAESPLGKTGVQLQDRVHLFFLGLYVFGTHLAPSVCRIPTVTLALRQLLDAIIHCNAALARGQVLLRDLYPA